jgi:RNA polymerase sigma factor (sigma-70 family)
MLAAGARSDVHQAPRLFDEDLVPHAPGDDQGLILPQVDFSIPVLELESDPHPSGHEVQELVGIGMHLPSVRRLADEQGGTDRIAIDPSRWPLTAPLHEQSPTGSPFQSHDLFGQLERHSYRDLLGRFHVVLPELAPDLRFNQLFPRRTQRVRGSCLTARGSTCQAGTDSRTWTTRSGKSFEMEESDSAVIAASLKLPETFGELFDRHGAVLLRFLARRVPPSDAEALLGDVFRIAFERRADFQLERESARPWLYGIAANVVAKHQRSEDRRLRATVKAAALRTLSDDPGDEAVPAIEARTRWSRVADAINDLPAPERQAILLFAWEELSYEEIADALGVPVGTVRSRLNRARTRLVASTKEDPAQHARPQRS